jgi:hypothetical protein
LNRGARIPRTPAEVLGHRYGDCKDLALLLTQLLTAAGVDAELALVRSWGPVQHELPSLDQFDHMIVYLKDLSPHLLDPTTKFASMAEEPAWLGGQEALVLRPGAPQFVTIVASAPELEVEVEREVRVEGEHGLTVDEKVLARGRTAWMLREMFSSVEARRRGERLQSWLGGTETRVIELEELGDPEKPLALKVRYRLEGQLHLAGNQLVAKLPSRWERSRLAVQAVEPRSNPFLLRWPATVKSETRFHVPKGFLAVALTPSASQSDAARFGTWALSTEALNQTVTLSFAAERHPGSHPAEAYAAFHKDSLEALAALEQPLVLEKTAH